MGFIVPPREQGPKVHLPVGIILDRSGSTDDIRELMNQYVQKLVQSLKNEVILQGIVEMLVVHYSKDFEVIADFKPVDQISPHELDIHESDGATNTGRALLYALQRLDEKKVEWKLSDEKYFQPLLFLLTDGYPDAGEGAPEFRKKQVAADYALAARQIHELEQADKIVFVAVGIQQQDGECANMEKLRELSSFDSRVLCVTDSSDEINGLGLFYKLILKSTNAVVDKTPVDDIFAGFMNAKAGGRSR